jgi:four helix bundle protein
MDSADQERTPKNDDRAEFDFERLLVYQKAVSFANEIYRLTKGFPRQEQFVMANQLRRAALSVSLNIAEGVGRDSFGERKRFYLIARGSTYECVPLLKIAESQDFVSAKVQKKLRADCYELASMLNGLIKSLP